MGRTKDLLGDLHITEEDILDELTARNDDEYQYKQWMESQEFVEYVNAEIDSTKPLYSESDIMGATRYASEHITIEPSEVGKKVYDMLFSEKIEEYLSLKR
jgi:hypothetical protein